MIKSRLLFLHLPKTGGVTVHEEILKKNLPKGCIYPISFSGIHEYYDFMNLDQSKKEKYSCYSGHFNTHMHRFFETPSRYITFMRDPVERTISFYFYMIEKTNSYLYESMKRQNGSFMSIEEFIESDISNEVWNQQTATLGFPVTTNESMLAHYNAAIVGKGTPPPLDVVELEYIQNDPLSRAKANIETLFDMVGVVEEFDKALHVLQKLYGFRDINYRRKNKTKIKKQLPDGSEERIRKKIAEKNNLDVELYAFVKERFSKQYELLCGKCSFIR